MDTITFWRRGGGRLTDNTLGVWVEVDGRKSPFRRRGGGGGQTSPFRRRGVGVKSAFRRRGGGVWTDKCI
jgi:hypothetical protein